MLDFASSLYLGLHHPTDSLKPWRTLSLGRPASLQEPDDSVAMAGELASLVGCEAGILMPSSFHLFWDVLGVLKRHSSVIYMDASTYPIARWGAEHWAAKGVGLRVFPAHDASALERKLDSGERKFPIILCDGFCPGRRSQPPIAIYAELARRFGGCLLIDDTQALGIYGHSPSRLAPYGRGGGGSLQRHRIEGPHVVVGASLAKGFGVPVALLATGNTVMRRFKLESASREHMSPPSMAVVQAVRHVLDVNRSVGDRLRQALWRAVRRLRDGIRSLGLTTLGGDFPVQALIAPQGADLQRLHGRLLDRGVRTVLHRDRGGGPRLSFLVSAAHSATQIDHAIAQLAKAWQPESLKQQVLLN